MPWKYEIQIWMYIKFYWNTATLIYFTCFLWWPSRDNGTVMTRVLWPSTPNMFTIWCFKEKVCPCFRGGVKVASWKATDSDLAFICRIWNKILNLESSQIYFLCYWPKKRTTVWLSLPECPNIELRRFLWFPDLGEHRQGRVSAISIPLSEWRMYEERSWAT